MEAKEFVRIVDGADVAVLMIHGIVGTPAHFEELLPLIPEEWSICNLLLDGHGKGVREFGASSMEKWKAQVSARLEELLKDHRRVLIIAHSMGTLFAIRAAVERPERIAGLFLLNVPTRVHLPPRTILAAWRNMFGTVCETDRTACAMRKGCGVELTPYVWQYIPWIPRFIELLQEIRCVRRLLPQLCVPTRAFHTSKDELVSDRARTVLLGHPNIVLSILPRSGHFVYEEQDLRYLKSELEKQIKRIKRED